MNFHEYGPAESPIEVVVPTADVHGRWFPACLRSIEASSQGRGRTVAVESSGPDFNFARSVNAAVNRTRNDILILNDDATLAVGAYQALLRARRAAGDGVYQLFIHLADGRPSEIGWYFDPSILAPLRYAWRIRGPFATVRKLRDGTFYPFLPLRKPRDGFD